MIAFYPQLFCPTKIPCKWHLQFFGYTDCSHQPEHLAICVKTCGIKHENSQETCTWTSSSIELILNTSRILQPPYDKEAGILPAHCPSCLVPAMYPDDDDDGIVTHLWSVAQPE